MYSMPLLFGSSGLRTRRLSFKMPRTENIDLPPCSKTTGADIDSGYDQLCSSLGIRYSDDPINPLFPSARWNRGRLILF